MKNNKKKLISFVAVLLSSAVLCMGAIINGSSPSPDLGWEEEAEIETIVSFQEEYHPDNDEDPNPFTQD